MKNWQVAFILLILIVIGSLVNSSLFEIKSLTAYFSYIILVSLFAFYSVWIWIKKRNVTFSFNILPVITLFIFVLYIFVQSLFILRQSLNLMHFLQLTNLLFLVSCCIFFRITTFPLNKFFIALTFIAGAESAVCLLQYFSVLESTNKSFLVTGTWVNPNVTAMFLTMSVPSVILFYFDAKRRWVKWVSVSLFFLLLIALLLLKCRTAIIGLFVSLFIIANLRFSLLKIVRQKFQGSKIFIPLILASCLLLFGGRYLYYAKESSSQGRQLIWKISGKMIVENPVIGYGYGNFDRFYNLAQAKYFQSDLPTEAEKNSASYVSTSYNEFIQVFVEGGAFAFVFLLLFFITTLFPFPDFTNLSTIASYAGISSFLLMSLFNFSFQGIPSMVLFVIYLSAVIVQTKPVTPNFNKRILSTVTILLPLFFACTVFLFWSNIKMSVALYKFNRMLHAGKVVKRLDSHTMEDKFEALQTDLKGFDNFWMTYASFMVAQKKYKEALPKFQMAANLKSSPEIFIKTGVCYQRIGNYDSAVFYYKQASDIAPAVIYPKVSLMRLYKEKNDTINALNTAQEILSRPGKKNLIENRIYIKEALLIKKEFSSKM